MVGTRSDRAFSDTHNKRGLVRAFDLTSDKRNDIYFASVTALFVISDKRRFYIYIYIYTMGSRSRRSRSTGRGGSNWKRAALVLGLLLLREEEEEEEELVQRPCRFSHSTKIPEVRLLPPLPSPRCIYRAARAKFELVPCSRNGRSSTGFFFAAIERATRVLERSATTVPGSERFLPLFERNERIIGESLSFSTVSSACDRGTAVFERNVAATLFRFEALPRARSAFPRATFCTVNILSGRLINRA